MTYFNFFTFRYLLLMPSNPWLGDYLTINEFLFSHTTYDQDTRSLPAKYVPGNTLSTSVMIWDIILRFTKPDLYSHSSMFQMDWSFWRTDSDYTLRFHISPYVNIYFVRYLVIMFDRTMLRRDFAQYRFSSAIWTLTSSAENKRIPNSYPRAYMFGISKMNLHLTGDPSISFKLEKDSSDAWAVDIEYRGSSTSNLDYGYSFTAFPYYVCDQYNYPYYNESDNDCYDKCPSFQFMNSSRQCSACRYDCLTCYDENVALPVILPTDIFKIAISHACPLRDSMNHTSTRQVHATLPAKAATALALFALHVRIILCIL